MTRVFYCSTYFGAMTLAAAMDAGMFGDHDERRLLIVSANSAIPEITRRVDETAGFDDLRGRFDDVRSWNDLIAPLHPADWSPRAVDVPLLSRLIRIELGLGEGSDEVSELVVESISVAPARVIAGLIRDCPITVFSDGLMSYGPTRDPLPTDINGRLTRLLYLDLVPNLEPLLLREYGVTIEAIPDDAFARVLAHLPVPRAADEARGCPVILGQYLSALRIGTPADEAELHADMLRALVARGHRHVVFKPHPAAGRQQVRHLRAAAAELRVRLTVVDDSVSAEAWFRAARPDLVVSCFSTALFTASHFFGLSVAATGCEAALERIAPYENSNRIPATIVAAVVPQLHVDGSITAPAVVDVGGLVRAVGFCMQSARHPDLRAAAVDYLLAYGSATFFKRRRLEAVALIPAPLHRSAPVRLARRAARRGLGRARRSVRRGRWSRFAAALR